MTGGAEVVVDGHGVPGPPGARTVAARGAAGDHSRMDLLRHPLIQALLVTIIALWLLGGVMTSAAVRPLTWALLAFAVVVAAAAWWKVLRRRGPDGP